MGSSSAWISLEPSELRRFFGNAAGRNEHGTPVEDSPKKEKLVSPLSASASVPSHLTRVSSCVFALLGSRARVPHVPRVSKARGSTRLFGSLPKAVIRRDIGGVGRLFPPTL